MAARNRRDRILRFISAVMVLLCTAAAARAQTPEATLPAYRARLLGVFNIQSGDPVEGAEVIDLFSRTKAVTTATGTVSLVFLPEGGSMVRIQKIGYEPSTQIIPISPADTAPVTILLKPLATTLPTVVTHDSAPRYISPNLQAFEERRRQGHGKFISEAELRKNDSRSMTNLMRQLGVMVKCTSRTPIRCFAMSMRQGCEPDIFVDGTRLPKTDMDGRDLEKMLVNMMGGVEVYMGPSTVPVQYNATGNACGALLFWSRER